MEVRLTFKFVLSIVMTAFVITGVLAHAPVDDIKSPLAAQMERDYQRSIKGTQYAMRGGHE